MNLLEKVKNVNIHIENIYFPRDFDEDTEFIMKLSAFAQDFLSLGRYDYRIKQKQACKN